MTLNKRFFKFQFPAIFWVLVLFIQSSLPTLNPPSLGISAEDKLAHIIIYTILGYLMTRAFFFSENKRLNKNAFLLSIIIGLLYGIFDEIHQMFVPGRYADVFDVVADFIGVLLAQVLFRFIKI